MRASLGMRQPTAAPAPPAPAEKVKLAVKSPTASGPMSNADVIDLRKAGLDDDNLIAAIKDASATKFDLTPAGLKVLALGQGDQPGDHRDARAQVARLRQGYGVAGSCLLT